MLFTGVIVRFACPVVLNITVQFSPMEGYDWRLRMVIELSRAGVGEEKKISVGAGEAMTMMMWASARSKASASANAPVLRFIFRFSLFLVVFFIYYLFSGKLFM